MTFAGNRFNLAEIKEKTLFEIIFWAGPLGALLVVLFAMFLFYLSFRVLNLAMKVAASWFGCFDERLIMKITCFSFLALLLFGISYLNSVFSRRRKEQ